jgi:hypothetical protein
MARATELKRTLVTLNRQDFKGYTFSFPVTPA